ncbi:multiple monosaccharide ABC transporter ATP-binding protein [Aristaeella lactis]|uniref:Multiple sugar transport system ATP-binding protein n=1 Tax=Aristaeella lactis TaxID=3046383 RepID=A0AC61PPI8_9FIRM|nr:multiple monosaccharide ABC transporter ATP-binding protein [Aristaeella lactis]QUA54381.1 ATP-binding cassette domain-containing protein [Aristaeella lactis]SMC83418.1 putative multiple sugar transport system ATP-binding protein [Aristaeella lactis]
MAKILLEMKNITKTFPGVKALDNVNFQVEEGEIHALVGENGAGKSTLMNVLSGIYPYGTYEGDIIYDGKVCEFHNIKDSEKLGIVIIHQELALVPEMTIGENMYLGNECGHKYAIDWNTTYAEADKYLRMVGLSESSKVQVKTIGTGKQQLVEIAKALAKKARLLILDEPTSSLNEEDSRALLDLMLEFKKQGMTMIIISHKLNEVAYVADTITVVRDGATIETIDNRGTEQVSEERIIKGMVGREITNRFPKRDNVEIGDIQMEVDHWTVHHPLYPERKVVDDVSMYVRKGEVVGIYGLMGAGRTELAMSIFGQSYGTNFSGELKIDGKPVKLKKSEADAIKHKIAYVTEDRKGNGLVLSQSIKVNTSLAHLDAISSHTVIDGDKEYAVAEEYRDKLKIKTPSVEQLVGNLSGGNQQKVLLAKWMFAEPDIMLLDEPTRGIDVGAKYEIYCIINDLAAAGKSVVMISSELPEVLGLCDRIYIMNEGKMVGEMKGSEATQESIMAVILKSGRGE